MGLSQQQVDMLSQLDKQRTFNAKLTYLTNLGLPKIGSGSGRIVFDFGGGLALKLAKNAKGVAQNEVEESHGQDYYLKNLVAEVTNASDDGTWIVAELARKVTPNQFKALTGVDIKILDRYLRWYADKFIKSTKYPTSIDPSLEDLSEQNEFVNEMIDYILNYGVPVGDLGRISSYGVINRGEGDRIVLIDYGLSEEVYSTHYARRNENKEWASKMKMIFEDDYYHNDIPREDDTTKIFEMIRTEIHKSLKEEKHMGFMPDSKIVQVKKECTVGGLGNTSKACNQGDINNLVLTNVNEEEVGGRYVYNDGQLSYIKDSFDRLPQSERTREINKSLRDQALSKKSLTLKQHKLLFNLLRNGKMK